MHLSNPIDVQYVWDYGQTKSDRHIALMLKHSVIQLNNVDKNPV